MVRRRKKSDYDVGYGKPPQGSQFKPGKSGNPKGRPKNTPNLKTAITDLLSKSVTVREDGSSRRVSSLEAILLRQRQKALEGNQGAALHMLSLFTLHCDTARDGSGYELTGEDIEIIQQSIADLKAKEDGGSDGAE